MKKQLFARLCVKFSIFLSLISFISFTLAFYFPNWKHIKLPDDFKIIINQNNRHYIDPLLRGEIEKYIEFLYRRGEIFLFLQLSLLGSFLNEVEQENIRSSL